MRNILLSLRSGLSFVRKNYAVFRRDWDDLQRAMRPMDDPTDSNVEIKTIKIWQIPPRKIIQVFKETFSLYVLSITNREAAIKEIERDEEIIRLKHQKLKDANGVEIDMSSILKEVDDLLAKQDLTKLKDAMLNVYDRKDEIKDLLAEKLQTFSEATEVMMDGYKDGKEVGLNDASNGEDFLSKGMQGILDSDKESKDSSDEK